MRDLVLFVLLSLPFVAAGVWLTGSAASDLMQARAAYAWVAVPATVLDVSLVRHRGAKGGATYSVGCTYSYRIDAAGAPHESSRVSFDARGSSEGVARERFDVLAAARAGQRPITAWVNPQNPDDAVLFRDPSPAQYALVPAGLVPVLLGGGICVLGMRRVRRARRQRELQAEHPGRPWRWEPEWSTGHTLVSTVRALAADRAAVAVLGVFTVVPMVWMLLADAGHEAGTRVFAGMLGALVVGLIGVALRWQAQLARYGVPVLELDEMPVVPGRTMTGRVIVPRGLTERARPQLAVVVLRVGPKSRDELRRLPVEPGPLSADAGRVAIPVAIAIPRDLPARNTAHGVRWALELTMRAAISLHAEFQLPVYPAGDALVESRASHLI